MKKFLMGLSVLFLSAHLFAQSPNLQPNEIVLDSQVIGSTQYFTIAKMTDSLISDVRVAIVEIQSQSPDTVWEYLLLIFKLLSSGLLASLIAQGTRVFIEAKKMLSYLPRGEWIVALISTIIGAVWLYLETKFTGFTVLALFTKSAMAFSVAIIAWRAGLSKIFIKPETANQDKIEAAVEAVIRKKGLLSVPS